MIEIEMVIPFEIKQDQNQSNDHRGKRTLFLLLPPKSNEQNHNPTVVKSFDIQLKSI